MAQRGNDDGGRESPRTRRLGAERRSAKLVRRPRDVLKRVLSVGAERSGMVSA